MYTTPAPMAVDSPSPPPETRDLYTIEEHERLDQEVQAKLEQKRAIWRENPSLAELENVLRAVVQSDPKLHQKYLDQADIDFPRDLETTLSDAWREMSFQSIRILRDLQNPETEGPQPPEYLAALRKAMTCDYKGTAVNAFIQYLEQNNIAFNSPERAYYGRFCSITQISGAGKTRLLFELGKEDICVLYMNIRSMQDVGYPPRDAKPANILTQIGLTEDQYRLQCRTFFATVFKCLATFLQKESNPFGVLSNVDDERRTKFLEDVGREFRNVKHETLMSSGGDAVMKKHLTAMLSAKCLSQNNENRPKVVIALDDACVLHEKLQIRNYLLETVLLQTIKEYSGNEAVWVVFA